MQPVAHRKIKRLKEIANEFAIAKHRTQRQCTHLNYIMIL